MRARIVGVAGPVVLAVVLAAAVVIGTAGTGLSALRRALAGLRCRFGPDRGALSAGPGPLTPRTQLERGFWATDRRSAGGLGIAVPATLAGVAAAALFIVLAIAVPGAATGDAVALALIVATGVTVAVWPPRGAARRRTPALIASTSAALLIFLAISAVLPGVDGFVENWHPPTYTEVTRLVDPVLEFAVFVLLSLALVADLVALGIRSRRRHAARASAASYGDAPNEMVVLPGDPV
jgi:hypothetical protein